MLGKIKLLLVWSGICWLLYFLIPLFKIPVFGVLPRTMIGLGGILMAPFLHGSLNHLIQNSIFFIIFGGIFYLFEQRGLGILSAKIVLLGGLFTWVIGTSGQHIGASGLIFGLWSYLLFRGWFQFNLRNLICSTLMMVLYGSMIYGIFPVRGFISWEMHLGGFLAGIWYAREASFVRSSKSNH